MSKFGTLVWIKSAYPLDCVNAIAVQVGRTVMSFTLKKNYNFMPFCFKGIAGYIPQELAKDPNMGNLHLDEQGNEEMLKDENDQTPKEVASKI